MGATAQALDQQKEDTLDITSDMLRQYKASALCNHCRLRLPLGEGRIPFTHSQPFIHSHMHRSAQQHSKSYVTAWIRLQSHATPQLCKGII